MVNPIAHYQHDEQSGTALIDSSPLGNNGILNGVDPSTDSVVGLAPNSGRALVYSGAATDWANLGNTLDFTGDFTVMAYLHLSSLTEVGGVVSRWDSMTGWLVLIFNGKVRVYRDGSFVESTVNIPLVPFHVAVTAEGTTGKIYFDAVEVTSGTFAAATHTLAAGTNAQVGSYTNSASSGVNLDATIDDVRVYDSVLSAAEVGDIYNELQSVAKPWLYTKPSRFELV